MIQSINFPLAEENAAAAGGWNGLREALRSLRLDGVEGIWAGVDIPPSFPPDMLTGYHLTFWPDWLDFYRGDRAALLRKFGSWDTVRQLYGGTEPSCLLDVYHADLARAAALNARYVVFHVSDVSLEEGCTYRWQHTSREVLDAALELIGLLLRDVSPTFDFLVENQWWPGFTFTDPRETEYLLSRLTYPRAGILLDTGHLMNTELSLRSQREGVEYILRRIREHGALSQAIRGVHFHQSVSGAYVRKVLREGLPELPAEYFAAFRQSYAHIQRIDRHRPWTDPACVRVLEALQPDYLTHELAGTGRSQLAAVKRQLTTIRLDKTHRP